MIAIVAVRAGELPLGAHEAVAEAGGKVILIGDGAADAVDALAGIASHALVCDQAAYAPARWASGLAALIAERADAARVIILPASPDGRDLAPRLAHALDRPLVAGAVQVTTNGATVARQGGLVMEDVAVDGAFVATLQPGVRGADVDLTLETEVVTTALPDGTAIAADPALVEIIPPDPATMDLGEAPRIVGGGAGLGGPDTTAVLADVAAALGCSIGGTRVITDWGWLPFERQIGTTGVTVDPDVYLAFGISGAVQHVAGLGSPDHIISVNTDASCPMMTLANIAIVADAPAVVRELAARLDLTTPGASDA